MLSNLSERVRLWFSNEGDPWLSFTRRTAVLLAVCIFLVSMTVMFYSYSRGYENGTSDMACRIYYAQDERC